MKPTVICLLFLTWNQSSYCNNETISARIVGGTQVVPGTIGYQASVEDPSGKHLCSGTILSQTVILTTAHCVYRKKPSDVTVRVGITQLNSGGLVYGVYQIRPHRWYSTFTYKNNIAILKLSAALMLSPYVKPIPLRTTDIAPNSRVLVTGWGFTSYPNGNRPNRLQMLLTTTISLSECKWRHFWSKIDSSNLCTYTKVGEGMCQGDSGGPLVFDAHLVGIVSWGRPCAVGYPDVFTKILYYINWINKNSS